MARPRLAPSTFILTPAAVVQPHGAAAAGPVRRADDPISTSELPHLVAMPANLANLVDGVHGVQRQAGAASFLQVSARPVD